MIEVSVVEYTNKKINIMGNSTKQFERKLETYIFKECEISFKKVTSGF